jgi:hypothetical protein
MSVDKSKWLSRGIRRSVSILTGAVTALKSASALDPHIGRRRNEADVRPFDALREHFAVFLDPNRDIHLIPIPSGDADGSLVGVDSYASVTVQREGLMDILRVGGNQNSGGRPQENQAA